MTPIALLEQAMTRFRVAAHAYHRILKTARRTANQQDSSRIVGPHLAESLRKCMMGC